jgi:hypothetical protein
MRRLGLLASTFIVACGLLTGCGLGNESSGTPDNLEPTETPVVVPTALSGAPRLGEVVWTSAVDPITTAPVGPAPQMNDPAIFAVFPIEALPAGTQLLASWYFNNTSLDGLGSALRVDQDQVSGWVEFHLERTGPDPWPDGDYEVVVTDGTTEIRRAVLTISKAA